MVKLIQVIGNRTSLIWINVDHIIAVTPYKKDPNAKTMIVLTRDSILVAEHPEEVAKRITAAWQ